MALPLPLRNRLAELIVEAFDELEARHTLEALDAFCRGGEGVLDPDAEGRLTALGWFRVAGTEGIALLGAYQAYRGALCRRVATARSVFQEGAALQDARTRAGLLARAALLADRGLFFEVHELLEPAWMRAEGTERLALQALIQVAVAFHHVEQGNREGAVSLLNEGLAKLSAAGSVLPLDTRSWEPALATALTSLREGRPLPPMPPWPRPQGASSAQALWRSS